jgi:coniferyl-aldehyde dehydrogenase
MTTETMGPVLAIITYRTIDEAIDYIKNKDKPMAIYYFGHNYINSNLTRVMNETSSGAFVVNECGY